MKTTRLFLLLAATVLAVRSPAAAALVGAFVGPPNNPATTRTDTFPQAGWGFYAPQLGTKQVNRLGFWVSPTNPGGVLAIDHDIALYNYTGGGSPYRQIAAATVPAGATADANGYAWASIPALTLADTRQGGDYYIVTATMGTDVWAPNTGSANVSTLDATFGTRTGNGWSSGSAGPPGVGNNVSLSVHGGMGGYYGPNIGYIPELPAALGDDFAILSSGSATFDGDAVISGSGTTIGVGAVEYLVVGGGGEGGRNLGGGGGAGGFRKGMATASPGATTVEVGAGGNSGTQTTVPAADGAPSQFGEIEALGGGGGGNIGGSGSPGASGGGGANPNGVGAQATQGNEGGNGNATTTTLQRASGGGGGAGGAGQDGGSGANGAAGSDGGPGLPSSITGSVVWYAGGGGGGRDQPNPGLGQAGGGNGGVFYNNNTLEKGGNAVENSGSGGGGGSRNNGGKGAGGSGVVHIRYAGDGAVATGGTAGPIAGTPYTLHSYTNVGASSFAVDQGIDPAAQRATFTGNLSGSGRLAKTAPGTLILAGSDNSYTGATTVREGTLLVDGALTGTSGVTVGSGTIYFDSFDGYQSDNLQGAQPVIGTGSWAASTHWKANGSNLTSGNANAFLPFTPEPGNLYSLSLDVNTTAGGSDWIALGYTTGASVGGNFHPSPNNAVGWTLRRANGGLQTFLGPSTGGGQSHDDSPGWVNVEVQLDTTGDEWLFEWLVDGTPIRGPQAQTNLNIAHVAFGAYGNAQGYVDNFRLDILQGLPTAVLGGTGAIHADTTIGRFGTLSPGNNDIGALTFADAATLTFQAGATIDWEFINESEEGTTYDHIAGDALYLPDDEGAIGLNIFGLDGYSLSAGDRFTLFSGDVYDASSTLFDPGQDITHLFNITDDVNWWGTWEVTAGSLVLTAVPEPASWLLLLWALVFGLLVRRRK